MEALMTINQMIYNLKPSQRGYSQSWPFLHWNQEIRKSAGDAGAAGGAGAGAGSGAGAGAGAGNSGGGGGDGGGGGGFWGPQGLSPLNVMYVL